MPIKDRDQDINITHAVTNYLNAGLQGRFTFLNVLSRLGNPAYNAADLEETKKRLARAIGWNKDLAKGVCVLSAAWTTPETFEAKEVLGFLADLGNEIGSLAAATAQAISKQSQEVTNQEPSFLIAAFSRYAYSKEHYLRGFLELSKLLGNGDMANHYQALLEGAAGEVKLAHEFLSAYQKDKGASSPDFGSALTYHCLKLPGTFMSQRHDVIQLVSRYSGGLTFERIGISPEQAKLWENLQASPAVAGYWEAHGIGPDEAAAWAGSGIGEADLASDWRLHGFTPQTAIPWVQEGFPAVAALGWASSGYTPQKALESIREEEKISRLKAREAGEAATAESNPATEAKIKAEEP
ncbi:MAG: hypothetical protein K1X83_15255 [Oligoflexia bacterium]|nr:hypothetical protein [Oligoflexia bacterium]